MEFNFSFLRLALLAMLLAAFSLWGGFKAPEVPPNSFHQQSRVNKGWGYCVLLFVVGAVSVSLVEHRVGLMDPTNLRPAYVLLGVVMMLAGVIWLRALKHGVEASGRDVADGGMALIIARLP